MDYLVSDRGSIETLVSESKIQNYFFASLNGTVVGTTAVKENEVAKLFVDPGCHGLGVGSLLFRAAEQCIHKSGYEEMIVGVMADSAIGFYEKMGMSMFDEKRPGKGGVAGCKILLMRKSLGKRDG